MQRKQSLKPRIGEMGQSWVVRRDGRLSVEVPGALVSCVMKTRTSDFITEDVRLTWLN